MLNLTEINLFPVKSLAGIALEESRVERPGLQYDRRWMLVDPAGKFVTQREIPAMALLGTALEPPVLTVFSKADPSQKVSVPLDPAAELWSSRMVEVWSNRCRAWEAPADVNEWFSDWLGHSLRLVYMPETTRRAADGRYAPPGHLVGFADAFPFLIIGQASLDDLNGRMARPLPMNRFRPNFVFSAGEAFMEDNWTDFTIGAVPFRRVKPCGRCIITTTDQETAGRGAEPLRTLATYRKEGTKILFGQYVVWMGEGETVVRVGAAIQPHL